MAKKHGPRRSRGARSGTRTDRSKLKTKKRRRTPGKLAGEVKIRKSNMEANLNLASPNPNWFTPWTTDDLDITFLNPEIYQVTGDRNSALREEIGHFIPVGAGFNERVGRRVFMLNTDSQLVVTFVPKPVAPPTGEPPTGAYSYVNSASLRVVHGWVKRGPRSLIHVRQGLTFWQDFSGPDFEILSDTIHTRQLLGSGFADAINLPQQMLGTYAAINMHFNWDSQRYLTFSTTDPEYNGWAPFVKFISKYPDKVDINVEYLRNDIRYQDA